MKFRYSGLLIFFIKMSFDKGDKPSGNAKGAENNMCNKKNMEIKYFMRIMPLDNISSAKTYKRPGNITERRISSIIVPVLITLNGASDERGSISNTPSG